MLPTRQEIVDQAECILVMAEGRAMYAAVLATAIAGRLNEQAHAQLYDAPAVELLLEAIQSDARYAMRDGVAGLPIVECAPASQLRSSGTHLIATLEASVVEVAPLLKRSTA